MQNTLSLNYCAELFKELFPTCWSITSHDEQLNKLYLLCFLFVSNLLELLQTILKTCNNSNKLETNRKQVYSLMTSYTPTCLKQCLT